jgi:hypothetical protein
MNMDNTDAYVDLFHVIKAVNSKSKKSRLNQQQLLADSESDDDSIAPDVIDDNFEPSNTPDPRVL